MKTVIRDHAASYADPVVLNAGDPIRLTGEKEVWDGHAWLWAEGPDGKAGWVPDTIVQSSHGKLYARHDYSAMELTCFEGETLSIAMETHGWAWCRSADGRQGWVPLRNLAQREP
ncbi:hypothetical protein XW59_022920 [Aquamicrobium sp. LC103]|nr:hypothetical protein XW59_022920 [Aquamicrobium sp. LC103]